MIIELGKASVATKAVQPNGTTRDPSPLPAGKSFQVGKIL
jgi:hypothetical protein